MVIKNEIKKAITAIITAFVTMNVSYGRQKAAATRAVDKRGSDSDGTDVTGVHILILARESNIHWMP